MQAIIISLDEVIEKLTKAHSLRKNGWATKVTI